jgi:hypothetical protein
MNFHDQPIILKGFGPMFRAAGGEGPRIPVLGDLSGGMNEEILKSYPPAKIRRSSRSRKGCDTEFFIQDSVRAGILINISVFLLPTIP